VSGMKLPPPRWLIIIGLRALLLWLGVRGLLLMTRVSFGGPEAVAVAGLVALLAYHDTRILRERLLLADLGYAVQLPTAVAGLTALAVESAIAALV